MLCRGLYYYSLFHKQMKLLYLLISNRNKRCPFPSKFKAMYLPALFHHQVKLLFYASGDMTAQHKQRLRTDWKLYSNVSECLMSFHSWSSINRFVFWYVEIHLQQSLGHFWCCTSGRDVGMHWGRATSRWPPRLKKPGEFICPLAKHTKYV